MLLFDGFMEGVKVVILIAKEGEVVSTVTYEAHDLKTLVQLEASSFHLAPIAQRQSDRLLIGRYEFNSHWGQIS